MKTMTRRSLAIVLAVMMVFSSMIMCAITANAANYDWYLVGDNADIFGAAWTPAQDANGMTKQADGTYIKTYEITKAATVEYKITDSQGWIGENQVPRYNNQTVTVAAGDTLTFTYNGTTLTASTGKPVVTYDYYVAGVAGLCGAEWNPSAEANGMTKQADGSYTKVYENVAAGTYKYKVTNGSWNTTYTDGSAGDKDNNSQVVVATADSTVTITLSSDKKVSSAVVAPAAPSTAAPSTAAPATTKTIYFTNADAWTTVNVYAYKMKSETEAVKLTGEWPGTAMTDAGKNEYQQQLVKADVDTSAEFVIFNDGTSEYKGAFDAEKNAYYWDGTKLVAYEYTVVEPTTAEPTTAEPTTAEPTTAEPTTVEPTTAEPTTQPAPVLADGFYLAGVDGHWTVDTISADLKFNANPGKEGEYVLNTTLKAGDGIKVVKVESNAIKAYYPDPGDNYTVTAEDAGAVTIYFSETYSVQWEKFGGYFYITPQAFDYTVTYNYNYDGEDLTVTKTVTAEAANIEDAIKANAPKVDNSVSDYAVGEIKKGEGNTYSVTLDATAKKYTVSLNGQPMDQEFAYMDKATVTSDKDAAFIIDGQVVGYGKSFTFFVVGDTDVTTDETKTIEDFASISKTATIAADGKVTVELLASAVVEKFDRMGVAFAKAEKTQAEIEAAVKAITSGTAASNKIAVHNSDVTEANESGQYQFIYAPYVTDGYSGKLYFYTFAVDTDGNVLVSAASEVDYANIGK